MSIRAMDCIFCKIISKQIPSAAVYEDEKILGFNNVEPDSPMHFLFVPKEHLEWKSEFKEDDLLLLGEIAAAAKKVAIEKNIFSACKLIFNIGKTGHIPHIHLHLLGGWKDKIPMHNI